MLVLLSCAKTMSAAVEGESPFDYDSPFSEGSVGNSFADVPVFCRRIRTPAACKRKDCCGEL